MQNAIAATVAATLPTAYGAADAALDILREEAKNFQAAGKAVWAALVNAVLAGVSVDTCRKAMRDAGVPKGTTGVYCAQVAALADAGELTTGVPQTTGAKAYAAARKAKREAAADAAPSDGAAPADSAAPAESKPDVIVLSGGLTAGMLPPAVDGVIRLDPTACAAMLRAVGWTVYAPGEAPVQTAPVRPRKSAVKA